MRPSDMILQYPICARGGVHLPKGRAEGNERKHATAQSGKERRGWYYRPRHLGTPPSPPTPSRPSLAPTTAGTRGTPLGDSTPPRDSQPQLW